jgi:hypothetical protein
VRGDITAFFAALTLPRTRLAVFDLSAARNLFRRDTLFFLTDSINAFDAFALDTGERYLLVLACATWRN